MSIESMSFEKILAELGRRHHQLQQEYATLASYTQMLLDKLAFERETMKALGAVEFDWKRIAGSDLSSSNNV